MKHFFYLSLFFPVKELQKERGSASATTKRMLQEVFVHCNRRMLQDDFKNVNV